MSNQDTGDQTPDETGTPAVENQEVPQEDPLKNLKSEVSRKFENQQAHLAQLNESLKALAAQLQQGSTATPAPASIREKIYDNPDEAAQIIEDRAVAKAEQRISAKIERQQAMQQRVLELTGEYPEFSQSNSEATLAAQRIHATLPESLKNTAEGAELAIQRAAMQLGLTPSSRRRRPAGSDDGYIPSSKGSPRGRPQSNEPELNDEQFTFAHLLNESIGRKPDEKKLKQYAGRKNWTKFSAGDES